MNKITLIGLAVLALTGSAQAVTLFELVSLPDSTVQNQDAGVDAVMAYVRGSGVSVNSGGTFNSKGWDDGTDLVSAVAAGNYIDWGFTAVAGTKYDLSDFSVRYDRSNTGPAVGAIQLSINGGVFNTVHLDNDINASGEDNVGISLAGNDNVTSAIFRFVGWNASSASGTFDFENMAAVNGASFQLTGTVQSVPEPTTMVVLAAVGLAAASRRQRK
jgi:hypothetical protein